MFINKNGYDDLGRPCKDLYFMNLCFDVSSRSIDPSSKHGCVAVDQDDIIVGTGYNGPVRGSEDSSIPTDRPAKYFFFEHAERNLIYHCARKGVSLKGCKIYITGFPCLDCLRGIIQCGFSKVVYGPYNSVLTKADDYLSQYDIMLKHQSIRVERFFYDEGLFEHRPDVETSVMEKCKKGVKDIQYQWNG
jgi:dCMP deaminase